MHTVAIYSLKSKFTDKGEYIQNQIELCKEYAVNHFNTKDFLIYEDEGYTGGNVNRPMFKKLLEDIKNKKIEILICYRLDRVSRNVSDFSTLIEFLEKYNVNFVSLIEQFDTSTPMGRAMMYITSVFSHLEREIIAERVKDNIYQLARTGRWLGGNTSMGYKSILKVILSNPVYAIAGKSMYGYFKYKRADIANNLDKFYGKQADEYVIDKVKNRV